MVSNSGKSGFILPKDGCIRAKMVANGQSGCIRAKLGKRLYSGIGKSGCIGCIRVYSVKKWLYSVKSVLRQKIGQSGRAKMVVFAKVGKRGC